MTYSWLALINSMRMFDMSQPKYAVIPDSVDMDNVENLKLGFKYEIIKYYNNSSGKVSGFYILSDLGFQIFCLAHGCAHLGNQNWELIYE
jgi:hypothetical protein